MKSIVISLLAFITFSAQAQITSTFDTDADGWTFLDSSTPITVSHQSSNGNPGGFVSTTYSASTSTTTESWFAPAKFLGNLVVRSLGRDFKFDLQQSIAGTGSSPGIAEIRIENGGNVLIYQLPVKPAVAPAWTSYSIKLDETGGWLWSSTSGSLATRSQIIGVLTNVTSIEIRGTYGTNATYTSGIDNVVLEQRVLPPAPTITSISPLSGESGTTLTINGNNFDATIANNAVYFGSMAGTITSASTTQLSVTIPLSAQYGPITVINKVTGSSVLSGKPFTPTFTGGGRIITASFKPRFDILLDATPGNDLHGLTAADLDGDGWSDLLVTESSLASVSIFRNLGSGGNLSAASFAPKLSLASSGAVNGLFTFDLDGDGKLDVVSTNASSFTTYRNTSTPGNLSFELVEFWSNPIVGIASEVVDVDGDGRLDLIGQHYNGSVAGDFWIALNISSPGNIEFGASITYFGGSLLDAGSGVTSGDLDNDGKPDLIVRHWFGGNFSIIKNNSTPGNISLDTPIRFTIGSYGNIKIADFNEDGKNDIAWKDGSGNNDVRIRINSNSGGAWDAADFATEIILDSELTNYGGMSVADVNGDGKPDIIATDAADVGVFENKYAGGVMDASAFVSAYQIQGYSAATYPFSPLVADLNGDNKPELILGYTNAAPVRISIFENNNVPAPVISVNTVSPLAALVGATVTITGNNFSTISSENEVYFGAVKASILSSSATQLTVAVPAGASYAPVSVRRGELTSRYRLPFTTTFSSGVTFDNTHFAPPVNFTLTNANYDIEVGDLNRDGKPDVLAEGNGGFAFRNTHLSGAISISSLVPDDTLSAGSFLNPRLEDFDGDGFMDAASVNGLAHRNISTPTEISFQPSIVLGLGASTMDQADFNNDGKMDLTVTTDLSGLGDLVIKENRSIVGSFTTGTFGSFSTNIVFNKPAAGGGIASEDFDGDGFADIATTNPLSDNISVYRNAGVLKISNAQFASRTDLAVGDNPGRIYKGDFDADGKVDLLLYHGTGANTTLLTVFHNTSTVGNLSFTRIDLTNPSATTVATIADLDGDGKPEIITTSETGNRFSIFKNIHTSGALTAASFAVPFNTTVTAPRGITTGDLNLDGKPEIILTRAAGLLVVYENLVGNPTITSFNPSSGPVGTTVTLTGANFSSTPASNIVTFNGIAAVVTASTSTSITTTVPAGATTGVISVTVSGATGISATAFIVTSPVLTPGLVWARGHIGTQDTFSEGVTTDASGNVFTTGSFDNTTDFDPGPGVLNLTATGSVSDIYLSKLNANGDLAWAFSLGCVTSGAGTGIATDAAGNVYVAGYFSGTVDFDPGPGTTNLTAGGRFLCKYDTNGNLIWALALASTLSVDLTMAVDAADNLYLAGGFSGTADFDPGAGTFNMTSAGSTDIFILKLSSAGNFIWARRMGSTLLDRANALALDVSGNVHITGTFNGTVDFDPGAGTANLTSAGATDAFILKLDNAGNYLWARRVGGTSAFDTGNGIALDSDDNVLITGRFDGTVDFDPGAAVNNLTSVGGGDAFVLKLNSAGNFVWAKSMGGTFGEEGMDIVCDAFDNVYTTGDLRSNTADFDPGPGTFNLSPTGSWEVYLSGLDAAGNFMWAVASQGAAGSSVYQPELSLDASGNIILIGVIEDAPADLDPGICVTNISTNGVTAFIAKLRPGTISSCGPTITINPQPVSTIACVGSSANFTTGATGTTNILFQWQYSIDGSSFTDIINNADYTGATTATLSINVTSLVVAGFYRCKVEGDLATTVFSNNVTLTVNALPTAPTVTPGSSCGPLAPVVLGASGGSNGEYRWYTIATGGIPIAGETSDVYTTPSIDATTTYYVSINNGICESNRTPVIATIHPLPAKPVITSSITAVGNTLTICSSSALTLSAPGGFTSYLWSDGSTTQQLSVSASGTYSVSVIDMNGCASPPSDGFVITVQPNPCSNSAPVITTTSATTTLGNSVSIDLLDLISDADNNLVLSSLTILQQPTSGAPASLNGTTLQINYAGNSFTGIDVIIIRICDAFGECTTQQLQINVIGEIEIFNAVSHNNDGRNDFFKIANIDLLEPENSVTIYNRWGSKVFEVENYNEQNAFRGLNQNGNELPSGTYFYKILLKSTGKTETGYLILKK